MPFTVRVSPNVASAASHAEPLEASVAPPKAGTMLDPRAAPPAEPPEAGVALPKTDAASDTVSPRPSEHERDRERERAIATAPSSMAPEGPSVATAVGASGVAA